MNPSTKQEETIVARATAAGPGAIGIIRLSGGDARTIAAASLEVPLEALGARRPKLGAFHDGQGQAVDQVLVTWFPGPHSYTGEDVVEISCHGSPFVCRTILEACVSRGARVAEPGEFTRRAFRAGKLDLVQAEGVRDLVASQTRFQAAMARQQLEGRLARELQPLRDALVGVMAHLETSLEFVEEDVNPESRRSLDGRLEWVEGELERLVREGEAARVIREGAVVVLAGRTNAGKSSIFNKLLKSERAMVTEIPGTTRDALREWLDMGGLAVCLIDTAGIRSAKDPLEVEGMNRSRRHAGEADLVLFVVDAGAGFGREDEEAFEAVREVPFVVVVNKTDLAAAPGIPETVTRRARGSVEICALSGANLDLLAETIRGVVVREGAFEQEPPLVTNLRQSRCLGQARQEVAGARASLEQGWSEEFACDDLRRALGSLGELTGETTTEDLLERIFSTFCIGK